MPVTIRRPTGRDRGRHPDLAIAGLSPPAAVLVEVLVAGDFARNVPCGQRPVFAEIPRGAPLVERIGSTGGREIVVNLIVASNHNPLPAVNRERLTAADHLALSVAHGDNGGLRIGIRVDAVHPGPHYAESQVGRIDFKDLIPPEIAQADRERPFRQADLDDLIVQVEKLEVRASAEAESRRSDVKLGPTAVTYPEVVAGGKRPVDVGIHPFVNSVRLERDRTVMVAEATHPGRGILCSQKHG